MLRSAQPMQQAMKVRTEWSGMNPPDSIKGIMHLQIARNLKKGGCVNKNSKVSDAMQNLQTKSCEGIASTA